MTSSKKNVLKTYKKPHKCVYIETPISEWKSFIVYKNYTMKKKISWCKICLSKNAMLTRWYIKTYILSKLESKILETQILNEILKFCGSTSIKWF